MSTGDLRGNIARLQDVLKKIHFKYEIPAASDVLSNNIVEVLLPALHYALMGYSRLVATQVSESGFELQAKSDQRFVEAVFKLLREVFKYRPSLTPAQFLSKGFAERKILLVVDIVNMCIKKHSELSQEHKLKTKIIPKVNHLESVFPPKNQDKISSVQTGIVEAEVHCELSNRKGEEQPLITLASPSATSSESEVSTDYDEEPNVIPPIPNPNLYVGDTYEDELEEEDSKWSERVEQEEEEDNDEDIKGFTYTSPSRDSSNIEKVLSNQNGLYFSEVVKADAATHDIARAFPIIVRKGDVNRQPSTSPQASMPQSESRLLSTAADKENFEEIHLSTVMNQLNDISEKFQRFQENVMAKFFLMEGRVKYLEECQRRHTEKVENYKETTQTEVKVKPYVHDMSTAHFIAQVQDRCKETQALLGSF